MSLTNFDSNSGASTSKGGQPNAGGRDVYAMDIFDLVRRSFWLIVFFVILCTGLAILYYAKAPKTYQSTAKIFIDEKSAPSVNSNDRESFTGDTTIEKYLQTLKSTLILQPAIDDGRFYDLQVFRNTEDILYNLREGKSFSVKPADTKSNSGVIKLSFKGDTRDECQKVLDSIVESFDSHIQSTTKNIGGENADIVQKAQDQWLSRLKVVEDEIEKLSVRPELVTVDGRVTDPYQLQLSLMHNDLHNLRSERNKASARIESVKRDQALGRSSEDLVSEIMSETSEVSDGAYARVQDQLVQLKVEEQELLNQYGNDHPQLRSVRRQIETVEQMKSQELASLRVGKTGSGVDPDLVASFLSMMGRKVELQLSEEQQIETQIKAIQQKSTSVSGLVEKLNALKRERERLEVGYAAIIERMSEMNAFKEHLWRNLSVLDPPSMAEVVAPKLSICLAAGLFLGSLSGLAFAAFKDMAEKTFRSSEDVGVLLGTSVIGHVNMFEKRRVRKREDFPNVAPELVSLHAPSKPAAEAYRSIRTTVFFNAQKNNAKVIQLTSPIPGDGKSTTVSNLAVSIAQSGKRVILVDADFRKPVLHKLFGLDNSSGATSVIYGETPWQEAAQVIIPGGLSVLPAGPIPHNPAELLTSEQFPALVETLKAEFDYVLIDTPPLLAVTDPAIVGSYADLLYLVMRIRKGARTNAQEARKILDTLGGDLAGVVINGLRRQDQKYYNYGGRYGYQYGGYKTYGETPQAPVGKVAGEKTVTFKPHSRKVGSSTRTG